jgi:hypothetical protein
LAKLIKWFTKSRFNHSALVLNLSGYLFITDSQIKGTHLKTIEEWQKKYNYKYIISRPDNFKRAMKKRAVSVFGHTPYDFTSLIYQAWYQITGKWVGKSKDKAEHRMYCSEYVSFVFNKPGWWKTSPADLFDYVKKNNNFVIIDK